MDKIYSIAYAQEGNAIVGLETVLALNALLLIYVWC